MAACASALCGISSNTCSASLYFRSSHLTINPRQQSLGCLKYSKEVKSSRVAVRSGLKKVKSVINNGDNGAAKPTKVILETLFAKTQKLEEMVSKNSSFSGGAELTMNLEVLGKDLQTALYALRTKEEHFKNAERRVQQEHAKLNSMRHDMDQQEKDIATAFANQRQLEEDLEMVNSGLTSKSTQIKNLNGLVEQQGKQIATTQFLLAEKENELNGLRLQLKEKNEEVDNLRFQLHSKERSLEDANKAIKDQEAKINDLQRVVKDKEYELSESARMRNSELERLKTMEADLEKQTAVWLLAQEELRKLTAQASGQSNDMKETTEDFKRVRSLLSTVRSELISLKESLAISWRKMEDKKLQFEKKLAELDEEKLLLLSYCERLEGARVEFEAERTKFIAARAQCQELESRLSSDVKRIQQVEEELATARASLEQKSIEITLLKDVILQKEVEYAHVQNHLQVKESELVETGLQIQQMKSEMVSLQLVMQEKDANLSKVQTELTKVNNDIMALQRLMSDKEEQLTQATMKLQEREEHIQELRQELDDTKFKVSEATCIIQQIAGLTEELVGSIKEETTTCSLSNANGPLYIEQDASARNEELKSELAMLKGSLRQQEFEVSSAKSALATKEEELNTVLRKWEIGEKERPNVLDNLLEDYADPKKLFSLDKGRVGDSSRDAFDIEKQQNELTQLEAEAATVALQSLADLTRHLVVPHEVSAESEPTDNNHLTTFVNKLEGEKGIGGEVARLFALTEQLVGEAGINCAELQCS